MALGPVEEWGDDPIATAAPAATSANSAGTRPRRSAAAQPTAVEKHVLVYGEDSLTEY
jgi:hypothetical protein